jgi:hypothetical protein
MLAPGHLGSGNQEEAPQHFAAALGLEQHHLG